MRLFEALYVYCILDDERAVSPVLGTILMVATVVILAAVVTVAVFGGAGGGAEMMARVVEQVPGISSSAVLPSTHG